MPKLQKSLENPSYPLFRIISGLKNAGVPHYSFIFYPFYIILEIPKSINFIL